MGIVTVVTSGKGGVGKSTVSVGLATELCKKGESVILIDMDSGLRSLDMMLPLKNQIVYDISDVVCLNCSLEKAIYECEGIDNLFLIPAAQDVNDQLSPSVFKYIVSQLSPSYDHVIIDCPAGLSSGFKASSCCADRAIVVTNVNPVCLNDANKVKMLLTDSGITDVRLVINRFSMSAFKRDKLYENLDNIIDITGIQLIAIVPEDPKAIASIFKGNIFEDKFKISGAFARLAARFNGQMVPLPSTRKF